MVCRNIRETVLEDYSRPGRITRLARSTAEDVTVIF